MKKVLLSLLAPGSLSLGLIAGAQETPPSSQTPPTDSSASMPAPSSDSSNDNSARVKPMSRHQMMKDCMARESAKSDGSTKTQMRKTCKAEVNSSSSAQDMMKK